MWTRERLKMRGKAAFLSNYWRCVAAALLLAVFFAGAAGTARERSADIVTDHHVISLPGIVADRLRASDDGSSVHLLDGPDRDWSRVSDDGDAAPVPTLVLFALGTAGLVATVIVIIFVLGGLMISLLVGVFLIGPLEVGIRRFFLMNARAFAARDTSGSFLDDPAPVGLGELLRPYQYGWVDTALTLFRRDAYLVLWSLLFVIPGIVKSYSYRMVPYILAEWPDMDGSEAIELSMEMMDGRKLDTFILDLSFCLWGILSVMTGGLAHVFFVGPYRAATDAELYEVLRAQWMSEAHRDDWSL